MGFRGLAGLNSERKDLRLEESIRTCSQLSKSKLGWYLLSAEYFT